MKTTNGYITLLESTEVGDVKVRVIQHSQRWIHTTVNHTAEGHGWIRTILDTESGLVRVYRARTERETWEKCMGDVWPTDWLGHVVGGPGVTA